MAQNSLGEDPSWKSVCGSWPIGSQLDKCLREQEHKQEVTGSVENGRKWLSFSLILWTFTWIYNNQGVFSNYLGIISQF